MRRLLISLGCVAALMVAAASSGGPAPRVARPGAAPDLEQMVASSGMIFLGRVEDVSLSGDDRVRITFRVLDGVRGARTGETAAVEEWRGLWVAGHERYQPGETLLLFFHPRSKLGLTSPVGGDSGRLPITPHRQIILSPDRIETMLPRSLRLQKELAALESARVEAAPSYHEFAKIVRELAEARP